MAANSQHLKIPIKNVFLFFPLGNIFDVTRKATLAVPAPPLRNTLNGKANQ